MLSQKRYVALLILAWVPFVARVVQIYLAANFQQLSVLATSAQLFRGFLDQQGVAVFLLIVGTSGAIADDRRANALQVYLSKPLTRVEYIAGKLFTPIAFVLGITLAAGAAAAAGARRVLGQPDLRGAEPLPAAGDPALFRGAGPARHRSR